MSSNSLLTLYVCSQISGLCLLCQYRQVIPVSQAFWGCVPSKITEILLSPFSTTSHHLLCSIDHMDVHVPRSCTILTKRLSFRVTGPFLWNGLSPSTCSSLPTPIISSLWRLKCHFLMKQRPGRPKSCYIRGAI